MKNLARKKCIKESACSLAQLYGAKQKVNYTGPVPFFGPNKQL
jgi:hypothetical protein